MKAIFGKAFARILEKKGWVLQRVKGSHHIYAKKDLLSKFLFPYTETSR